MEDEIGLRLVNHRVICLDLLVQEKIRVVEKEIPKVVKEIVTVRPECADLGPDFASVLNNQVRAANSIQSAETAPGVVN